MMRSPGILTTREAGQKRRGPKYMIKLEFTPGVNPERASSLPEKPVKIPAIQFKSLGDTVLFPALQAVRNHYPDGELHLPCARHRGASRRARPDAGFESSDPQDTACSADSFISCAPQWDGKPVTGSNDKNFAWDRMTRLSFHFHQGFISKS